MAFKKAVKHMARAKLAITGPSGSGKTYSALLLAQGLGGRTAVIDTENGSACLYADKWDGWEFDVDKIEPPYTAQKYFSSIKEAIKGGYDVLIIDSATHLWAGEGGLLEQKSALDSRGGNSYTNWGSITKLHEQFKSLIQSSPIHIITTMRSKQEYILEQNEKGKQTPKKVGLAPIQRDGMEYEFTAVFDIGMDHQFMASKDRTDLFDGVITKISVSTGEAIRQWLAGEDGSSSQEVRDRFLSQWETDTNPPKPAPRRAAPPANQPPAAALPPRPPRDPADYITMEQVTRLTGRMEMLGFKNADMKAILKETFGATAWSALTVSDFGVLWDVMTADTQAAAMAKLAEFQGTNQKAVP